VKKIHLLILKAFIRPFIVTFFIVMFVLLMLFLWKYIDDLVGKGFEWYTILKLMMYASATNVAMALPLSVLLSSIMTYGTLGENYELVAIKSAGISLTRALYPMVIAVTMLAISAFIFSDYMLPVANLKFFSLLYDARQQKSAKLIKVGVFNSSFPGYTIRVGRKDADNQRLYDIMIYEKNTTQSGNNIVFAKEGVMTRSPDNSFLLLKLKDGVRYEEMAGDGSFNPRQKFTRFYFKETEQKLSLDGFTIHRTPENLFKGSFAMLNSKQLADTFKVSQKQFVQINTSNFSMISPSIRYFITPHKPVPAIPTIIPHQKVIEAIAPDIREQAMQNASQEAKTVRNMMNDKALDFLTRESVLRRYRVEYQKKFTLSAACLMLFLIGAPLGAIIRKGGLGLPVVISVIFFLIYFIVDSIGVKSAQSGSLPVVFGTWIAIIILTPIGLFLSYKAANDSVLFDVDSYKRFFTALQKRLLKKGAPE
jgi:lipopolysaccharide export system permease protein